MDLGSDASVLIFALFLLLPPKLPEETPENQVARQDPRYRSPEEGKDAKRTYSIEACTAKMDWPCHKNA